MTKRDRAMMQEIYDDLKLYHKHCSDEGCGRCDQFSCRHTMGGYGVFSATWHIRAKFLRWLKAKLAR